MRTVFFISELDINGNSAGSARICNIMKALSAKGDVSAEHLQYCGHPRAFFSDLSNKIALARESAIYFYPSSNPSFEIMFLIWAKRHYSGHIFCDINEVRKYGSSYSVKSNPIRLLIAGAAHRYSERLSARYDGLVCISRLIQDYFSKYNTHSVIVPILSDLPEKMPVHKPSGNIFHFAFTGSVCMVKENLRELLKGFALLGDTSGQWVFDVYGAPPFNDYSEINDCVNALGLKDKVVFHGQVRHKDIPGILLSSDCLILPRRNTPQNHYGFSTKLSEYIVSGTPVILTDTGVLKDYFQDGKNCLLVRGYSAEGFLEQMKRVMQMSDAEKAEIASNAFQLAGRHFDYRLFTNSLSDFLR